jgi:hypothetical protein
MKNINVSAIILAAEKAEKEKANLEFQAERANKIARTCTTAEGRAKWEAKTDELLDQIKAKALDTSFCKPLDEALAAFEKPYRIRCFESGKNLLTAFQKVLDKIDIPKKYFDGTMISIKAYAGTFPSAYKGVPTTTEAIFSNKNGKWYLTSLDRITVKKDRAECVFSDATKEAIVKKYKSFYF